MVRAVFRLFLAVWLHPAAPAPTQPQAPLSADAQAWSVVQNTTSDAVLEEFIRRFPDSVYTGFANARLEELRRDKSASWWRWGSGQRPESEKPKETQTAVVAPPKPAPAPVRPAEDVCDDGLLVSVANSSTKPCIKPGSGESFKDCPDCPEMVVVPAGSFSMGSPENEPERESWKKGTESPQHKVTIAEPFAVGQFVVTRDEFEAFVKDSGHKMDGGCWGYTGSEWKQDSAKSYRSPGFAVSGRLRLQKRVDEAQVPDDEAVRHILGVKLAAAQGLRGGDNRAIPIREAVTLLDIERCRQDFQCHGLHGKARPGADQAGGELVG